MWLTAIALLVLAVSVGGLACGGSGENSDADTVSITQDQAAAATPSASQFPAAEGRSLQQLSAGIRPGLLAPIGASKQGIEKMTVDLAGALSADGGLEARRRPK